MNLALDVVSVIITTMTLMIPVLRIINGRSNIMHICTVAFYVLQVFPLILKCFWGIDPTLRRYPNMYNAMIDTETSYVYGIFVMLCILGMTILASTIPYKPHSIQELGKLKNRVGKMKWLRVVLIIGMTGSIIAVLTSPEPSIYLKYAYFYTTSSQEFSSMAHTYHYSIISKANQLALGSTLALYLFGNYRKTPWYIYASIFVITWISGKRTLLIIALMGILAVDYINKRYEKNMRRFIFKAVAYLLLCAGYFYYYSDTTGKGAYLSAYHNYSIYFSRMSNVSASIFDKLTTDSMIDYPAQSLIFDFLFWIPRSIWQNKPVIYSKYFTRYVMGYSTLDINWQFQINIWSEYISNLGIILGPIFAVMLQYWGARATEKTNSIVTYLLGMMFLVLYNMFGFESVVQYIGIAWIMALVVTSRIKIRLKH